MAVRVAEVDAAAAAPVVELAVVQAPRCAAVGNFGFLNAAEDGVEVAVADVKRVVMAFEVRVVVEQQRQRLVDLDRREVAGAAALEPENLGKEFRRRGLVAGRHDGVVENDAHSSLPKSTRSLDAQRRSIISSRRRNEQRGPEARAVTDAP